ncbi:hypothetical protein GCM10008932_03190 [Alkalibacterium iburiense]|uniref:Uncharacterized protein n=1 Tax=Alkalibacterium iburiense TaxID=290589 RepID=A0ABN0X2K4_9LACT
MTKLAIINLSFILLLLSGCTATNTQEGSSNEEIAALTREIATLNQELAKFETLSKESEAFSYLNDLTDQELHQYQLFLKERDIDYLKDFSPEKVVLLYFESIVTDDMETIYAITYDGGRLSGYSDFTEQFYTSDLSHNEKESVLDFRYYDTLTLLEENETGDQAVVEISVSIGSFQSVRWVELQKENNQWKLVLQHLL